MAFTVEDGTGVENANSYSDLVFADEYFTDRGITAWTDLDDTQKQIALIKGTDYIEVRWGGMFIGEKEHEENNLSFPRTGIYDTFGALFDGIVPEAIKIATCLYGLRSVTAELLPDPIVGTYPIKREMKKVGPIEKEIAYDVTQKQTMQSYPAADRLLVSFLKNVGGVYR